MTLRHAKRSRTKKETIFYLIVMTSAFIKNVLNSLLSAPKCVHKLATQLKHLKLPSNYISKLWPLKLLKENKTKQNKNPVKQP